MSSRGTAGLVSADGYRSLRETAFLLASPRDLSVYWSRRIDREHRLVHPVLQGQLVVVQARHHAQPLLRRRN